MHVAARTSGALLGWQYQPVGFAELRPADGEVGQRTPLFSRAFPGSVLREDRLVAPQGPPRVPGGACSPVIRCRAGSTCPSSTPSCRDRTPIACKSSEGAGAHNFRRSRSSSRSSRSKRSRFRPVQSSTQESTCSRPEAGRSVRSSTRPPGHRTGLHSDCRRRPRRCIAPCSSPYPAGSPYRQRRSRSLHDIRVRCSSGSRSLSQGSDRKAHIRRMRQGCRRSCR